MDFASSGEPMRVTVRQSVLLDDDPTGPQLVQDVPVLLVWSPVEIAAALRDGGPSLHLMTNTRALEPDAARRLTRDAAAAAHSAARGCRLVLRGDSTLRAHLVEEYDAVREVAFPAAAPVLLLLPAMPSGGRVTRGGVHYLVRDGRAVPVSATEYATDGRFAYRSSRLLDYAEERSAGRFPARRGREVPLDRLLSEGPEAVAQALEAAAGEGPAVVAPDAETVEHLELIRRGLELAERRGVPVLARCSPTFAAVLAGGVAENPVPVPDASGGLLVVCGSYVPNTTRQLEALRRRLGVDIVEVDVDQLASDTSGEEIRRVAELTGRRLQADGVVVVSTPRQRPRQLRDLRSGERIARNLARAAAAVRPVPSVVLTKGGITSAVTLRDGFGVRSAQARGPVVTGVSLWTATPNQPAFVVFPGNVGNDDTLADVIELIRAPSGRTAESQ